MRRFLPLLVDGVVIVRLGVIADTLSWSAVLAASGETFSISPTYAFLRSLAPEWVWSILFGVEAAACIGGLFCKPGLWRSLVPVGAAILYGMVAWSAAQTYPLSTGTVVYLVLALDSYWLIWMEGRARQRSQRPADAR